MVNILWVRAGPWSRLLIYLLLIAAAVFTLTPFFWAAVNSVKTLTETFRLGAMIPFLQFEPTLDSWREVLRDPQTGNAFISSCVISGGTTIFSLILGVPAAYSLARYEFPIPSNDIALWFLSQRVLPPAVVLVPFYLLLVYLRLIDTWLGLILCYSTFNLAFVVVIMRDIFR
ncbi:MAG: carbohydrate ABC transporter permease, partial [Bryobacteraceae bacterium]